VGVFLYTRYPSGASEVEAVTSGEEDGASGEEPRAHNLWWKGSARALETHIDIVCE
jgi:hypothetical protein